MKVNIQAVIVLCLIERIVLISNDTVRVVVTLVTWLKVKSDQSIIFPQSSQIVSGAHR